MSVTSPLKFTNINLLKFSKKEEPPTVNEEPEDDDVGEEEESSFFPIESIPSPLEEEDDEEPRNISPNNHIAFTIAVSASISLSGTTSGAYRSKDAIVEGDRPWLGLLLVAKTAQPFAAAVEPKACNDAVRR